MALVLEGYLECRSTKSGSLLHGGWKKRWCMLGSDLVLYSSRPPHAQQLGSVPLSCADAAQPHYCSLWRSPRHPTRVEIRNGRGDVLSLRASSADEMNSWANALRAVLLQHRSGQPPCLPSSPSLSPSPLAASSSSLPPGLAPAGSASPIVRRSSSSPAARRRRVSVLAAASALRTADIFDELDGDAGQLDACHTAAVDGSTAAASDASNCIAVVEHSAADSRPPRPTSQRQNSVELSASDLVDMLADDTSTTTSSTANASPTRRYTSVIEIANNQDNTNDNTDNNTDNNTHNTDNNTHNTHNTDNNTDEFGDFDASSSSADAFGSFDSSNTGDFDSFGDFAATTTALASVDVNDGDSVQRLFAEHAAAAAASSTSGGSASRGLSDLYLIDFPDGAGRLCTWLDCSAAVSAFERLMAELLAQRSGVKPEDFEAPAPDTPFINDAIAAAQAAQGAPPELTFAPPQAKARTASRAEIYL